jgi:hypothetical protein
MTALTVERRGARLAIRSLLAHPDVLAALLDARSLVDAAADATGEVREDALADLADALAHTWILVPARDLAGVVEVVVGLEARALVGAA